MKIKENVKQPQRTAYDSASAKSVSSYALLWQGKPAGAIVISFTDSSATATIRCGIGPIELESATTGKASGYGYCKASAACDAALRKMIADDIPHMSGCGMDTIRTWFESLGYIVFQTL